MNILKYISKFPFEHKNKLGEGADGEVFQLDNKAIKYSILFDYSNIDNIFKSRFRLFKSIKENSPNIFPIIYDFNKIEESYRLFDNSNQKYIVYYYVMDFLNKISDDEFKVFHTLLSHEDSNLIKNYSNHQIESILCELNNYLNFDKNKVQNFIFDYKKSNYIHLDLHPRNIMKCNGDFKLIDLDRMTFKKETIYEK